MSYPWNQARLYHPGWNSTVEEHRYRRPLHSSAMKPMLGLRATAKLPIEGMDPVYIQGVKVWVNPEPLSRTFQRESGMKVRHSATHRVRCECPMCGEEMSAGRLNQHTCKPKPSTFNLMWMPEGRVIATVQAKDAKAARKKAPKPYSKYKGEIHAEQIA